MKKKTHKIHLLFALIFFSVCLIASVKNTNVTMNMPAPCSVCDLDGCSPAGDFQTGGTGCTDVQIPGTSTTACALTGSKCNSEPH